MKNNIHLIIFFIAVLIVGFTMRSFVLYTEYQLGYIQGANDAMKGVAVKCIGGEK